MAAAEERKKKRAKKRISFGFMLRIIGGGAAISVQISSWMLLTAIFLCLFLAISKRRAELTQNDKNSLEKQIKNPNIIIVNSPAEIQLDNNMMTGQNAPIMAVLASDDDGLGKDFAQKMVDLAAETTGVKAFSMSYNPAFETYEEGLRKASLVYLMDRKINMDGAFEKEILESYKKQYCKSPSKYAVVGFDVVNDMLSRENSKGELFKQMSKTQTQLATKFEFIKSKEGAYINTGCRVVRLIP